MSMWNASSDLDYSTECHGPYAAMEARTCANCSRDFQHFRDGEYEADVLCGPDCLQAWKLKRARRIGAVVASTHRETSPAEYERRIGEWREKMAEWRNHADKANGR